MALAWAQVPFFVVVTRLEADKAEMAAERERWKAALLERQSDVARIEQQMQVRCAASRRQLQRRRSAWQRLLRASISTMTSWQLGKRGCIR